MPFHTLYALVRDGALAGIFCPVPPPTPPPSPKREKG